MENRVAYKKMCVFGLGHFGDAVSATPFRRRPFGDGTFWRPPFRRQDVLATAGSATGRFGDRQFGDGTFRRRVVLATDVSAMSLLQYFFVKLFTELKLKRQTIKLFVSFVTLGQKKMIW
jgi:hypothetical protein